MSHYHYQEDILWPYLPCVVARCLDAELSFPPIQAFFLQLQKFILHDVIVNSHKTTKASCWKLFLIPVFCLIHMLCTRITSTNSMQNSLPGALNQIMSLESYFYLAAYRRHRWSTQIAMKVDKVCSFQPALRPSSAEESGDVYCQWPGRCRSLSFFLTYFFIILYS